jgi:hypothetical protein
MGEDAAFEVFAKGLADIGPGAVVVALAIELTGTGQLKPGLKMLGYGLVEQRAFGVARVVELGFGTRWPTRVRMRLRWACSGGHGAVPAWAGCLMILCLYPDLSQAEPTTGRANTPDLIAACAHFTRAVARFGSHTDAQPVPHHRATTIAARPGSPCFWCDLGRFGSPYPCGFPGHGLLQPAWLLDSLTPSNSRFHRVSGFPKLAERG